MRQIRLAIGLMTVILTGCGTTSPYLEVGVGYALDDNSDWYLRTEREWTCHSPATAHFEVGLELEHDLRVGYHHQSHWSCGGPFNDRPELYQDEIIITKKWGGK